MPLPSPVMAFAALAVVLGLIWMIQRALRSDRLRQFLPAQTAAGRVRVLQVLALDARRRLHLVQCEGRDVLLLTGGGGDLVVGWIDGKTEA